MTKQLDLQQDEPEGCCISAAKRVFLALALLVLLVAPCGTVTRQTTFTIEGTRYPAKCLHFGQRTLGCDVYRDMPCAP